MARGALGIGAVLVEALAKREPVGLAVVLRELRDGRRRRRDALAEQLLEHPLPAKHGAGAERVAGRRKRRGHAEYAPAHASVAQRHAPHLRALHTGYAVEAG